MRGIGFGMVAGLGMAGLLVAAAPVSAQTSPYGSSQSGEGSAKGTTGQSSSYETMGSQSDQSAAVSPSSSSNELSGRVEKFDRSNSTLSLAGSDKKLKLSDDTTVMKDGQKASLSDIKEGDQVRASFSGSGVTLQATQIWITSSGAAEAPKKSPSTETKRK